MRRRLAVLGMIVVLIGLAHIRLVLSAGEREIWVTSQGGGRIFIRALSDGRALGEIKLPDGAEPHITTFHSSHFAYVSDMGQGRLYIIDAQRRQVVHTLRLAPTLTHQAKTSPDGTIALVSVIGERKLVKIAVDEAEKSWQVISTLSFFPVEKRPICTVFRADGRRAYVSMLPSGIAIVDVRTMTLRGTLDTDGFVACGMIKTADGNHAVVASSGGGGHIYTLDMTRDTLMDRGTLGMADWHSFIMTADGTLGFGTSPMSDEVVVIDLTAQPVKKKTTIRFAAVPGSGTNQPDALGGGEPIVDNILPVSLRAAGQVALVDISRLIVKTYVPLMAPTPFDHMTCKGCAVHGITIRP